MTKEQLLAIVEALEAKQDAKEELAQEYETGIEAAYSEGYADGMRFAIDTIWRTLKTKSDG